MITFVTHMRVSSTNATAFEGLMNEMCAEVHEHEPGVVFYEFSKSASDPSTYMTIEVYRNEAAVRAHADTDYLKALLPKAAALVERGKFEIEQYVAPGTAPVQRR